MSKVRPILGGKPSCPKWNGVWLIGKYARREKNSVISRVPAGCGSWECEVCGEKARRKWYQETVYAFERIEKNGYKCGMLTLTFRTKKKEWSWNQFKAVRKFPDKMIDEAKATLKDIDNKKLLAECQKFQTKYGEFAGVLFRHLMTGKQMNSYITACERALFRWMRDNYDGEVHYRGVREFTKQNMAHVHYIITLPDGVDEDAISKKWEAITYDSNQVSIVREMSVQNNVGYMAKYLTKGSLERIEGWQGLRRHKKSNNVDLPILGNDYTLRYVDIDTGAYEQFNKRKYERVRARAYYHRKKYGESGDIPIRSQAIIGYWRYMQMYQMRMRDVKWEVYIDREQTKDLWMEEKYFWNKEPYMQWMDGYEERGL